MRTRGLSLPQLGHTTRMANSKFRNGHRENTSKGGDLTGSSKQVEDADSSKVVLGTSPFPEPIHSAVMACAWAKVPSFLLGELAVSALGFRASDLELVEFRKTLGLPTSDGKTGRASDLEQEATTGASDDHRDVSPQRAKPRKPSTAKSLAAILLITGWKLANPKTFKQMWNAGWTQFLPFIVTILTMVFTDLLKGVVVGLIFTIVFLLWENLKHALRRPVHEGDHELLELGPHVTFLHKANVLKELGGMPKGTHIVVDATKSYYVDPDVVEALQDFRVHRAKDKGLTLEFVGKIFDAPAAPSAH